MFPSLIGSIKRSSTFTKTTGATLVSIPYRKYKKAVIRTHFAGIMEVSIPYRKYKKEALFQAVMFFHNKFPSLIGSIKSNSNFPIRPQAKWFPSLIGSIKREPIGSQYKTYGRFPSLIGSIKRYCVYGFC